MFSKHQTLADKFRKKSTELCFWRKCFRGSIFWGAQFCGSQIPFQVLYNSIPSPTLMASFASLFPIHTKLSLCPHFYAKRSCIRMHQSECCFSSNTAKLTKISYASAKTGTVDAFFGCGKPPWAETAACSWKVLKIKMMSTKWTYLD